MPEKVDNQLLYEVLKSVQAQVAIVREDVNSIKGRMSSQDNRLGLIQSGIAGLHVDLAEVSGRMDRLDIRIDRVETRLNLHDPQH